MRMKYYLIALSVSATLLLSGCGSSSSPSGPQLGDQEIQPDGSIDYIDYTGEKRNAVATVAESEYHTGKGYGHTLFDSADKKCQNCHN
ncbi:MAG: hypothetical protein U9N52_02635, partial [Campylobacterota bacterium]|nr:hypothetical protein [Campylobacterota bacterium]